MFFFKDTATTEIYTLSLHDALPIFLHRDAVEDDVGRLQRAVERARRARRLVVADARADPRVRHRRHFHGQPPELAGRSEEHTSELQSRQYLVCRLLLEKKNGAPQST